MEKVGGSDGRIILGWLAERKSDHGTYFKGGGFGAVNLLLTPGQEEIFTETGNRVWTLYAVPRTDSQLKKPGSARGAQRTKTGSPSGPVSGMPILP